MSSNTEFGRLKNDEKIKMYIRDNENTLQYSPENYTGNKFLGLYNKVILLQNMLFRE